MDLQFVMDLQIQTIHNGMLPFIDDYPALFVGASYYEAANWVSLINLKFNKSNSCAKTKKILRYALYLIGKPTLTNPSLNLSLSELPQQFSMLEKKSCFGLGLKNADTQADHYVFFFRNQDDNYVLIHSWQWRFSLHEWLNAVDLRKVADRQLVKLIKPWKSPRQFILGFIDGWKKQALLQFEGIENQQMRNRLQSNTTELLILTVMKEQIKQIFWHD